MVEGRFYLTAYFFHSQQTDICSAAKADFTVNEKTLRPEPFSFGSSRKNGETALHVDRVDRGCFIECQQGQMKRQCQSLRINDSPKCVSLFVAFAKNHQVNVCCIWFISSD
jgi:hypothetical protein